jgi:hypothetical protein
MYVPGKGPGLHPSSARGPRLKSLELPLCVCIYTHTSVHIAARDLPGLCPAVKPSSPSVPPSTDAGWRRASNLYLLVRGMNEDHAHTN